MEFSHKNSHLHDVTNRNILATGARHRHQKRFKKMAEQWGKILATAHSRAAETMLTQTALTFAKNVDKLAGKKADEFIEQIQEIAKTYAAQVALDYQAFKDANPDVECFE